MRSAPLLILLAILILAGCASPRSAAKAIAQDPNTRHRFHLAQLQEQRDAAAQTDPHAVPSEDNFIWYGRRLAYLGHYEQAIVEFTEGLKRYPNSYKLLRHRGHRHITLRRFDLAVEDLARAAELIEGVPDEIEPDGLPNPRNIPTSTSHTNIYYHLGLARSLRGEFDLALDAYERCMSFAANDDMRIATAYWLYLTQRRLGMEAEARATLAPITPAMDIIENTAYHELLLLFKRGAGPGPAPQPGRDLDDGPLPEGVNDATLGYGLGMWRLLNRPGEEGEREARDIFRSIVADTPPAAFGHIAAEAELARQ